MSLVRLSGVHKSFARGAKTVYAVNGISLEIEPGETVGLIGESGSGKSTAGRLALGLTAPDRGVVHFEDQELARLSKQALRGARARMTAVFQEPYESLNPRRTVGDAVSEPLRIHERRLSDSERRRRVENALEDVGLGGDFALRYPHELSGGQQQRIGIARAIITRPSFVVLDEPTSSLDLSVRAQVLNLLARLQDDYGLAYLLISHDLATVEHVSDRVGVMYLGQLVETGPTPTVLSDPKHPYTRALLSSTLSADPDVNKPRVVLAGEIPNSTEVPRGCPLYGRCPLGTPECTAQPIPLRQLDRDRAAACIHIEPEPSETARGGSAHTAV